MDFRSSLQLDQVGGAPFPASHACAACSTPAERQGSEADGTADADGPTPAARMGVEKDSDKGGG
jgi:hypothetical protein